MKELLAGFRKLSGIFRRFYAKFVSAINGPPDTLRRIGSSELTDILVKHQKWLDSDGKLGAQANLESADLRGANLERMQFQDAKFGRCDLRFANLRHANLSGAIDLLPRMLAGSDLTGARLPSDITWDSALEIAKEEASGAAHLFGVQLLACCYSLLTIGFTTDTMLFSAAAASLPIVQVPVPIVGFYLAVPCILLCLYLCFHFQLLSFWKEVAELPVIFPDGRPVQSRLYFWVLFAGLFGRYRLPNTAHLAPFRRIHAWIASLLIWWLVPLTLFAFRIRYVPRHDPYGTAMQAVLLVTALAFAFRFKVAAARILRPSRKEARSRLRGITLRGLGAFALLLILFPFDLEHLFDPIQIGPNIDTGDLVNADLYQAELSLKPAGWNGQMESVKGARLRGVDLRRADLIGAFLVKADLTGADLREAALGGADLRNANLGNVDLRKAFVGDELSSPTNLSGASLMFARLQGASLSHVDLSGANLQLANLEGAILSFANFRGADLQNAKISGPFIMNADFTDATFGSKWLSSPPTDLRGAVLTSARGLSVEQLKQAVMDSTTVLPKPLKDQLNVHKP